MRDPGAGDASGARLERGLALLGFEHPKRLAARLLAFSALLLEANRDTNLVGANTIDELVAAHILDSLAPLAGRTLASPVIDVGSGAGLPGIPVALAFPGTEVVLLEPRARRASFLRGAISSLGLVRVDVLQGSAERAGRGEWRDRAGTALVRALARSGAALELALPLLRPGGRLYAYTGRERQPGTGELETIARLRSEVVEARPVEVPYLDAQRHVWIIEKRGPTPAGIPASARARRAARA